MRPDTAPGAPGAEQSPQAAELELVSTSARFLVCGKPSLKSRAGLRQTVAYGVCIFTEFSSHSVHSPGPNPGPSAPFSLSLPPPLNS